MINHEVVTLTGNDPLYSATVEANERDMPGSFVFA
jgi:hypothetical protein